MKVGVDSKFREKTAHSDVPNFSKFRKISQVLTFGMDLEVIWKFHVFLWYLDIYRQIDEL